MSLLMHFLRSLLAPPSPQPATGPALAPPDAPASADQPARVAAPAEPPAWRLLEAQAGVQDLDYGDHARPAIQHMFRRPPRRILDIGCASGAVGAGLK